jgi:O-antigen ligase
LILAPLIAALIGIYQFVDASGPASFLILGGRFARAASTFGKPNPFAGYMNMAWPLALGIAVFFALRWTRGGGRRALAVALLSAGCMALLLGGLFASYSRGGWIGAVSGLMGLALLGGRRTAAAAALVLVLCLLAGLLGAFSALPPVVVDRIQAITDNIRIFDAGKEPVNDENFAVVERMAHWQAAWGMWLAYPIFGVGPGNFNAAYPDFFVGRWSVSQGHAHNYYLHILAECGLPGLGLYLVLIFAVAYQAIRLRRMRRGTVWEVVALGGCGIMLAVASHNVFENLHVLNLGIQLSGVWGLMIVAQRVAPE